MPGNLATTPHHSLTHPECLATWQQHPIIYWPTLNAWQHGNTTPPFHPPHQSLCTCPPFPVKHLPSIPGNSHYAPAPPPLPSQTPTLNTWKQSLSTCPPSQSNTYPQYLETVIKHLPPFPVKHLPSIPGHSHSLSKVISPPPSPHLGHQQSLWQPSGKQNIISHYSKPQSNKISSVTMATPSQAKYHQSLWQPSVKQNIISHYGNPQSNRISSVTMATLSQTEYHQSLWQPPVKQNIISHYGNPQSQNRQLTNHVNLQMSTDTKISTNWRKWYSRITLIISENDAVKSCSTKCNRANGALHLFFQICHQQKTSNPLLKTKPDTTAVHFQNHTEIPSTCFILPCGLIHTALWTDSYCTVDWFILPCGLIHTALWTDSYCFILPYGLLYTALIYTALWTALYCPVDCFILHCGLLHTALWTDSYCPVDWFILLYTALWTALYCTVDCFILTTLSPLTLTALPPHIIQQGPKVVFPQQSVVCRDKTHLLSQQKYASHNKTFVMTNIFVNIFLWQQNFCRNKDLSRQTCVCPDKSFVATSILLLRQKTHMFVTTKLVMTKLYLWQLPPMTV